jgi:predicted DNA-binding transcriptional regulator AlpA
MTLEFLDQLLNEKQLAAWLGISLPSLQRMRSDGTGPPFIQLSQRRIAYKKSSVEGWLQRREITRVGQPIVTDQQRRAS